LKMLLRPSGGGEDRALISKLPSTLSSNNVYQICIVIKNLHHQIIFF